MPEEITNKCDPAQVEDLMTCTRCGSEFGFDLENDLQWPDPEEYAVGERFVHWLDCPVETDDGHDPMGEFHDGAGCDETNFIYRVRLDVGWGPISHDRETST